MYSVDENDKVIELSPIPQCSVGAPLPVVLSDEHRLLLAYLIEPTDPGWDGTTVRIVTPNSEEPVALVEFDRHYAHMFGPPNDEAFRGHPLAARGLHAYAAFQVEHSSWIRQLERMNSIHPRHKPESFKRFKHYVFAFHDSTFECIAEGLRVKEYEGPLEAVLEEMKKRLWQNRIVGGNQSAL
ncbi:MAG TPA: hypothetical protein VKN18_10625 [Blastocatellia bacterium]|nr:hypothetical protein [Blastocatellia bacterium]